MLDLLILGDGGGAELHEESGKGAASGATVEPEDYGVVLGIVARLKEPYEMISDGGK